MLIPFVPARQLLLIKTIPLPSENDTESPLPKIPEVDMSSARDAFQKIVLCLSNLLLSRSLVVVNEKRVIPQDYKSLVEIDDQKICMMQKHLNGLEQLMDLIKEAIELNQQVIKGLIDTSVTQNNKEIEKHKAEIRDLESELEDDKQEYIKMDALLSMTKYAREQIKKAFDKEMLT